MLYSERRKKEVINMRDCRKLGQVVDLEIDEKNGCIRKIKVVEKLKCKCFHYLPNCCCRFCGEPDYIISYHEIKKFGPDIIVVDIC